MILSKVVDPWKAENHAKPWEGLTKSRFRTFRKSGVPGVILYAFWEQFWSTLALQIKLLRILHGLDFEMKKWEG